MEIYKHLNLEDCHLKATETGRAAHMIRNYLQGFTAPSHPELACVNNLASEIEGNVRTLRALLTERREFKLQIRINAKAGRFLQKILAPGFYEDDCLNEQSLAEVRELVETINKLTLNLDQQLNLASIKESCELFKMPLPAFKVEDCNVHGLMDKYCPLAARDQVKLDAKFDAGQRRAHLVRLSSLASNQAHEMQDLVAEFTHNVAEKEQANKVINIAGNIENDARGVIGHFNSQPNINVGNMQKLFNQIMDNAAAIRQLVEKPDFLMPGRRDEIVKCCMVEKELAELAQKALVNVV